MVTASASPAGSAGDPLISQRHLEGVFADSLHSYIRNMFDGAAGQALSRLNELYLEVAGYSFARRYTPVSISAGSTVALGPGASFILTSGTATLTVNNGTVINVSTGAEVFSGAVLTPNERFFCTENTTAVVFASTAVHGMIDGFYYADGLFVLPPLLPDPPPPYIPGPPAERSFPFTDVPTTAWFHPAVNFVFQNELFAGTAATLFSPGADMTRGMFVTVLHRLDGLPAIGAATPLVAFTDVRNPDAFYFNAVNWATAYGIAAGFDDGSFGPNLAITREQMASIMYRYAFARGRNMIAHASVLDEFPDRSDISPFAAEAMTWAVTWGVLRGAPGGWLMPRNTASRAEVAQIILNYTERIGR